MEFRQCVSIVMTLFYALILDLSLVNISSYQAVVVAALREVFKKGSEKFQKPPKTLRDYFFFAELIFVVY